METPANTTPSESWVSLRDASQVTGIPVKTLRYWYGTGKIESKLVDGKRGPERRVLLGEVEARQTVRRPAPPAQTAALQPLLETLSELSAKYAEAAASAARYQTESEFLRERLADLRAELEAARQPLQHVEEVPVKRWWQRKN